MKHYEQVIIMILILILILITSSDYYSDRE
jgi:hypothetical protein